MQTAVVYVLVHVSGWVNRLTLIHVAALTGSASNFAHAWTGVTQITVLIIIW